MHVRNFNSWALMIFAFNVSSADSSVPGWGYRVAARILQHPNKLLAVGVLGGGAMYCARGAIKDKYREGCYCLQYRGDANPPSYQAHKKLKLFVDNACFAVSNYFPVTQEDVEKFKAGEPDLLKIFSNTEAAMPYILATLAFVRNPGYFQLIPEVYTQLCMTFSLPHSVTPTMDEVRGFLQNYRAAVPRQKCLDYHVDNFRRLSKLYEETLNQPHAKLIAILMTVQELGEFPDTSPLGGYVASISKGIKASGIKEG